MCVVTPIAKCAATVCITFLTHINLIKLLFNINLVIFFYINTRGFPHFDGGEYFVWPMYVCSVLSIGKEGLSEFI